MNTHEELEYYKTQCDVEVMETAAEYERLSFDTNEKRLFYEEVIFDLQRENLDLQQEKTKLTQNNLDLQREKTKLTQNLGTANDKVSCLLQEVKELMMKIKE